MKRRDALKAIAATGGAVCVPAVVAATAPRTFGRMTLDRWDAHRKQTGEFLHVYVDGVDVTDDCFEADDVVGYALVYCRDYRCPHAKAVQAYNTLHVYGSDGARNGACAFKITGAVSMRPEEDLRAHRERIEAWSAQAERFGRS